MFGKLKQQRRIATRYDKTILSFESFLNLAAARLWLKAFVNKAQPKNVQALGTLAQRDCYEERPVIKLSHIFRRLSA
jgi:hypothetical protein